MVIPAQEQALLYLTVPEQALAYVGTGAEMIVAAMKLLQSALWSLWMGDG